MAENSKIEWTDHTFNPWTGCTQVSPACDNCYAEAWAERFGHVEWGPKGDRRRTKTWGKPIKWDTRLNGTGRRERVFCASLADVFDNHRSIRPEWRHELWEVIRITQNLDWLLLTKRPQNIAKFLPAGWGDGWPNVWLGATVENQTEAERRIPHLLRVPARVHFVSCEPLFEPLNLRPWLHDSDCVAGSAVGELEEVCTCSFPYEQRVRWAIVGGESGPGARPMHPQFARNLRDQCRNASVPFLFKQWGDWAPWEPDSDPLWKRQDGELADGNVLFPADMDNDPRWNDGSTDWEFGFVAYEKIGKKAAGRCLDGKVHDAMPEQTERW